MITDSQKTMVAFITGDVELPTIAMMLMLLMTSTSRKKMNVGVNWMEHMAADLMTL